MNSSNAARDGIQWAALQALLVSPLQKIATTAKLSDMRNWSATIIEGI
jgi:hypothetical protein